jgi:16S rRNA processing protein RimM
MEKEACYQLGYIAKPHGVSGEVSAVLDVDIPENYKKLESVFVEVNNRLIPFFIETISIGKNKAIIKFEDVDSGAQAEGLQSSALFLPLKSLPPLKEDQFYFHEVIGYQVIDQKLGELGPVQAIYNLPHQDLIAMDYKEKEVLIPILENIIRSVDKENHKLLVELPEGLLQVYLED